MWCGELAQSHPRQQPAYQLPEPALASNVISLRLPAGTCLQTKTGSDLAPTQAAAEPVRCSKISGNFQFINRSWTLSGLTALASTQSHMSSLDGAWLKHYSLLTRKLKIDIQTFMNGQIHGEFPILYS